MLSVPLLFVAGLSVQGDVPVQLDALYYERCRRPCEFVGFSFADEPAEMQQMREHGANAVGWGSMWIPTNDAQAPDGCGIPDLTHMRDTPQLGQSFTVHVPITGVALATPTFHTEGSGCTLAIYSSPPDHWQGMVPEALVARTFTNVRDNQQLWLFFEELPPGNYYIEQSAPTGNGIGVWAVGRDAYGSGQAYIARRAVPSDDLELWCRTKDGEMVLVAPEPSHRALRLGPGAAGLITQAGLVFSYAVGNWNNGSFPYYPDWFIKRFPEHAMLDQNGEPVLAGMFGELAPWPNLQNPVIVNGTERYIRAVVEVLKDNPGLLYWCMGGEALYATYLMPARWTDYSNDAIAHYRAWLKKEYGSIAALNEAWNTAYADFTEVRPPNPPARNLATLDWFRFRNAAMAERFQYHFIATKAADPGRLVVTCNHGNIFEGKSGTMLGQDLSLFAGVSDGWEMGQIMSDDDPNLYNLMWMRNAGAFGKPLCPVRLAYRKTNPLARGGATSFTPEAARRYFWESVGTGAWHMGFIQWRGSLPDGEWGVQGTPAQTEIRDILREWHEIEPYFDDAWPVKEPVGLYFSQLTWTLDGFQPLWTRLHRELTQRHIGYRILSDKHLTDGDLDALRVIISPDNPVISVDCVKALRQFRRKGGKLILVGRNATEDEQLRPYGLCPFGDSLPILRADDRTLVERIERAASDSRLVTVEAAADRQYVALLAETTCRHHDTPFDLSGHKSIGQTFIASQPGLRAVRVSNPTYTKTVTDCELTLELLAGDPDGEVLARKTYFAPELTDNAWHEVRLDSPLPAGTYYLRLLTPESLPPQTIGVWGTAADTYPGGGLHIDDRPVQGDLRLELVFDVERPPEAALESFTLSDGVNAVVILTNITELKIQATVRVSERLLPEKKYRVRDLGSGIELGEVQANRAVVHAAVAPHRSAVLFFEAAKVRNIESLLHNVEKAIAKLPEEAVRPHRAHLQRAREAVRDGRPAKALASVRRALQRVPMTLEAKVADGQLQIRATTFGKNGGRGPLNARFVPLPGVAATLARQGKGRFAAIMPLDKLGMRYDYRRRKYVPYYGVVEVIVAGRIGERAAAGSCVVEIPRR